MFYSELKSKTVLSLDGVFLGRVTGALIAKETNECDAVCCERGIFSPSDVYSVKDAVTLKLGAEDTAIPQKETHMFITESMDVYDCKGEHLGHVNDFSVDPHNKKEEIFKTETESYPFRKLMFSDENCLVVNRGDQLPRKKRTPKQKTQPQVLKAAPATAPLYPAAATDEVLAPASVRTVNYQSYGEYRFLIGRTLSRNLTDLNHNVVFTAGTVITNDVIEEAKMRGKLAELTKYSK